MSKAFFRKSRWYGTCRDCLKWFTHYEVPEWVPSDDWRCNKCFKAQEAKVKV